MISSWQKAYWLGGSAITIFLIVAVVMNPFLPANKQADRRTMGLDFLAFYTAGTFAQQHLVPDLYDLPAIGKFQQHLAGANNLQLNTTAPWWNPPIFALAMEPLATMSFDTARWTWVTINLLCLIAAIVVLMRMLPLECSWRISGLVALLVGVSMPAIQAIGHGQNSAISLLILAGSVTLVKKNRPVLAGLVIGALSYKPQIAIAVAVILSFHARWRVLGGFIVTAGALVIANMLILPGTLNQYVLHLSGNLHAIEFGQIYIWERQVTFGGFWQLLLHGRVASGPSQMVFALTLLSDGILIAGLILALIRSRGDERFVIAGLAGMPLLMPYFLDYDLLLLAVPAVMYAARNMKNPSRGFALAWTALYVCLLVNSPIGRITDVNLAVVILGVVSAGMIGECVRETAVSAVGEERMVQMRLAA